MFVATPVLFQGVCLFHPERSILFKLILELRLRSKKRFLKQVEKSKMKLTEQRRWALQGWSLDGLLVWLDGFCWLGLVVKWKYWLWGKGMYGNCSVFLVLLVAFVGWFCFRHQKKCHLKSHPWRSRLWLLQVDLTFDFAASLLRIYQRSTRWAPTSYRFGYNSYK